MSDYIKLESGQKESITLAYDQPFESDGQYGKQYIYGCNPIITGETKFTANPRVHGLILELGVSKGDTIIIEKVKANPNDYIKVGLPGVPVEKTNPPPTHKSIENSPVGAGFAQKDEKHKSVENFEKQFESKDDKIGLHELTLRVEKLEKMVTILSGEAGHKPGDEKLPF